MHSVVVCPPSQLSCETNALGFYLGNFSLGQQRADAVEVPGDQLAGGVHVLAAHRIEDIAVILGGFGRLGVVVGTAISHPASITGWFDAALRA